ncbi:hypothetical protein CBR_g36900 [Chara braunii]|uniref:Uncharacterized protein n=1 Tax=Chara braunii TaxID=69332 RepID=A0A388LM32_CHABU|nr:hypothetical protein CBR_g36900 [Chara braunii]|eukprot:GBG83285.1 hypothetical protein CBR_g36900 [Chara braunii]
MIRGTAYKMLFTPWMTCRELEERRRPEDASKFWVMAFCVPLRAMFPIADAIEQSMGKIINAIPPQPDPTRPKLMNMKFELAPEAEGGFAPLLPLRLDDGENINVELVCKHTPWCDRCKWWNHTATDGCPKLVQQQEGWDAEGDTGDNFPQRNRQQLPSSILGGIKEAAKDLPVEIPRHTMAESSIRAASRAQVPRGSGRMGHDRRTWLQQPQGLMAHQQMNGVLQQQGMPAVPGYQAGPSGAGFVPYIPSMVATDHQGFGPGIPGIQNYQGIWNAMGEQAWQSSILAATEILSAEMLGQTPTPENLQNLQNPGQARGQELTRDLVVVQEVRGDVSGADEDQGRQQLKDRRMRGDCV